MTEPLWNHGDHGGATAVYAVQAPQWHRDSGVTGVWKRMQSYLVTGVNRPAFGGTVPHFHQMSRGPAKSADVPHFSKMVIFFFPLPFILHVCLATQQSDELRIKIGKVQADNSFSARRRPVLWADIQDVVHCLLWGTTFTDRGRPHFSMDELNRPTPVRRRLSVVHCFRGKSRPGTLCGSRMKLCSLEGGVPANRLSSGSWARTASSHLGEPNRWDDGPAGRRGDVTLNGLVKASLGASCGGGGLHLPGPCGTAPEPPPPVVKWEGQCLRGWSSGWLEWPADIQKPFAWHC